MSSVYPASRIKRRASRAEMDERAAFLIAYAAQHGPCSVRQLFYQAEVHGIPGITKDDASYCKIQEQVLALRRSGELPYNLITDGSRWTRKPDSFSSVADAVMQTARFYRKALWAQASERVEVWVEKDALSGVVYPVTADYDVPLMVTKGFTSETFVWSTIEAYRGDPRPLVIYYLGDFDRSGMAALESLREKVFRFSCGAFPVQVHHLGVTPAQIADWGLPTREPKRNTAADRAWPYDFACELDAIPPDTLRQVVDNAIQSHLPAEQLEVLKVAEESERGMLMTWAREFALEAA